jgi:hypothetical protein
MPSVTDHPDDFDREWAYRRGYQRTQRAIISRSKWRPLKSSSMLSTRQLYRSNNQPASYAALTQFAPEPARCSTAHKTP